MAIDKIAKELLKIAFDLSEIVTKDHFLSGLLDSIVEIKCSFAFNDEPKNIHASFEDDVNLKIEFDKLKKSIPRWLSETSHDSSFYGIDFIERLLKNNTPIVFVPRQNDYTKNDPSRYGLGNPEDFRKFILNKINSGGLIFKNHQMGLSNGMPLDVFNFQAKRIDDNRNVMVYLKFYVKDFTAMFNLEFDVISCHDDKTQGQ